MGSNAIFLNKIKPVRQSLTFSKVLSFFFCWYFRHPAEFSHGNDNLRGVQCVADVGGERWLSAQWLQCLEYRSLQKAFYTSL